MVQDDFTDSVSMSVLKPHPLLSSLQCNRDSNFDLQENGILMTKQIRPNSTIEMKRQLFWRNVVKQLNFTDQSERELLLSLTEGICWMHIRGISRQFVRRHREIYHLISTSEYERSEAIRRDVTRTFSIFERYCHEHQLAAQQNALFRVLNAIAEAEGGYCQGMNFIAALFLVEGLSEADAYVLFLYILKKRHLAGFYHRSSTFLDDYLQHFDRMLIRDLPMLHAHLLAQGFVIPMYGIEWFTTLFSLSTKTDLACAIFDLFFVGVQDIFLRAGIAMLKLLESKLMCMTSEDFLREFKPLVRELDPYQVILQALMLRPNHKMHREDTTVYVSREHFIRTMGTTTPSCSDVDSSSTDSISADGDEESATVGGFGLHRTLPPEMTEAIRLGNGSLVRRFWEAHVIRRHYSTAASIVLANEILHFAVWNGRVSVACFAIEHCNADVNNRDDAGLRPLHFSVTRNQPDMVRLLLAHGACMQETSMRRLPPLELAHRWKRRDTTAARLVLEKEEVCLYCNTKFDVLALETAVCGYCEFRFCCKPHHALCIFKHQCPKANSGRRARGFRINRRLSEPTMAALNIRDQDFEGNNEDLDLPIRCKGRSRGSSTSSTTSTCTSTSLGAESSVTLSRSMTESSSSEVLRSPGFFGSSAASSWPEPPRIGDTAPKTVDPAQEAAIIEALETDKVSLCPTWQAARPLLEFPDRPEWYCNARKCHFVFALFSQAAKCFRCEGYFCSDHVNGKTKHCCECQRDVLCSPHSLR